MKRATVALRSLLVAMASGIGLEGAFLIAGVIALSVFVSAFHPLAPFGVVGVVCSLLGLALAQPRRTP